MRQSHSRNPENPAISPPPNLLKKISYIWRPFPQCFLHFSGEGGKVRNIDRYSDRKTSEHRSITLVVEEKNALNYLILRISDIFTLNMKRNLQYQSKMHIYTTHKV